MPVEPQSMYVEGDDAKQLSELTVGTPIVTHATGKLTSITHERGYDGKSRHSARIQFDRVRHTAVAKATRKRAASIRAGGPLERALEAKRGRGPKGALEKALERKRGVNPRTGD